MLNLHSYEDSLSKIQILSFLKSTETFKEKCKHKLWIEDSEVNMWEDYFYLRINYIKWKKIQNDSSNSNFHYERKWTEFC